MPINYNFAFKTSKLQRWKKPAPQNLLLSDSSFLTKLKYIYKKFTGNPELFYPSCVVVIITLLMQIAIIYPTSNINKLEDKHMEYIKVAKQLSRLKSKSKIMNKHLKNLSVFFTQPTPVYLFAFYLQNSIPKGVQLNNYFVSNNGFEISASAYDIEPLNDMVTLLIESPIVNRESLIINRINDTGPNKDIPTVILELEGNLLKLSLDKRERLYKESLAEGLLRKLLRFRTLQQLIRS